MEERLIDIELKLTSLEDTVQMLNDLVYEQRKELDEMRALCRLLINRQREQEGDGGTAGPLDERPPHY